MSNLAQGSVPQSQYSTKVELLAIGFWMESMVWLPSQAMVKLPFTVDQGGDPPDRFWSLRDRCSHLGLKADIDRQEARLFAQHTHRCIECFRLWSVAELSDLYPIHVTRHVGKAEIKQVTPALFDESLAGEEVLGLDG